MQTNWPSQMQLLLQQMSNQMMAINIPDFFLWMILPVAVKLLPTIIWLLKCMGEVFSLLQLHGLVLLQLKGGSTLHSLFKLPIPILGTSTCNVTPNSAHGRNLS